MGMLVAQALSAASFARFGTVLEVPEGGPPDALMQGAGDFDWDKTRTRLKASMHRVEAVVLPFTVPFLECHPLSMQLFVPFARRFLVVVAPQAAGGEPQPAAAEAFVGRPGQAFCYRHGVWHSPFALLDEAGEVFMMVGHSSTADDCWKRPLAEPITVALG